MRTFQQMIDVPRMPYNASGTGFDTDMEYDEARGLYVSRGIEPVSLNPGRLRDGPAPEGTRFLIGDMVRIEVTNEPHATELAEQQGIDVATHVKFHPGEGYRGQKDTETITAITGEMKDFMRQHIEEGIGAIMIDPWVKGELLAANKP